MSDFEMDSDVVKVVMVIFVVVLSFFLGYKFNDSSYHCHIDREEVEAVYNSLGTGNARFINPNTTIDGFKSVYDAYYPISNGIVEYELSMLCD